MTATGGGFFPKISQPAAGALDLRAIPPFQALYGVSFVIEIWRFLRVRKKLWLLPIVLVMLMFGGLIIFAQGSALAPFIYTLF